MKKVLVVLGIVVAVIVLIVVVAFTATSGLPKAANAFFDLIADGDVEGAYRSTAAEFQASTSLEQLDAFLKTSTLGGFRQASWSSRSIENSQGRLEGTVTVRGGGRVPVELVFVKEDNAWRLLHISKAEAGLARPTAAPALPEPAEVNRLVSAGVFHLAQSIKLDNFSIVYGHISDHWRQQTTPEELRGIFAGFVEHRIDLTGVVHQNPVLTSKPSIDDEGVLSVEGVYSHELAPFIFRMRFIPEGGDWKLIGIGADM